MPAQGGSTAQSGFVLQNSIAALKLAELLDIPNQKASIYITSVIVEALGDLIFVDDIVVRYKEHDRHWTHWIQVKEDIDRKGEAWSKLWIDITRQKENNLSDFDRIVIYIGTKHKFFEELQETCKRAEGKKTWEEWKPTGSMEKVIASIRESIFKYYQDEDNKNKLERLPSLEKINDNFILEMIARVDIEILTLDEILDKNNRLVISERYGGVLCLPQQKSSMNGHWPPWH